MRTSSPTSWTKPPRRGARAEAERKALLAGFRGRKAPGAERREDARTRQKDPKPFSSSRGQKRTREEGDERTAASPSHEPKPLLESRPAADATGDAERKGAERTRAAPLSVAATASSGSETSASGESDSQTASGGGGRPGVPEQASPRGGGARGRRGARARLKEKAAARKAKNDFRV